jgi:hypothetical protein
MFAFKLAAASGLNPPPYPDPKFLLFSWMICHSSYLLFGKYAVATKYGRVAANIQASSCFFV